MYQIGNLKQLNDSEDLVNRLYSSYLDWRDVSSLSSQQAWWCPLLQVSQNLTDY